MKVLQSRINANAVKDLQIVQHQNVIYVEGQVPSVTNGGMLTVSTKITSYGDFLCNRITGKYNTLTGADSCWPDALPWTATDDGTCHLRMTLRDGTGGVDIFEDYIPLDLFFSPGRVREQGILVDTAGAGIPPNPSQQLFYAMPLEYVFRANNDLTIQLKNDSTCRNRFSLAFWGIRLKSAAAVRGL